MFTLIYNSVSYYEFTDVVIILFTEIEALARQLIKDLGCFVITRRCVMDRYEKVILRNFIEIIMIIINKLLRDFVQLQHDKYEPGHVSPVLMSEVTKCLTLKDPVPHAGWLMFGNNSSVKIS